VLNLLTVLLKGLVDRSSSTVVGIFIACFPLADFNKKYSVHVYHIPKSVNKLSSFLNLKKNVNYLQHPIVAIVPKILAQRIGVANHLKMLIKIIDVKTDRSVPIEMSFHVSSTSA
jgi:hypothetical protein